MTKNFRSTLDECLKDSELRAEWNASELGFQVAKAIVEGRAAKGITQKELADITGINQGDISKLENGNGNPSLRTLERIAKGLDMRLKLEFVPA